MSPVLGRRLATRMRQATRRIRAKELACPRASRNRAAEMGVALRLGGPSGPSRPHELDLQLVYSVHGGSSGPALHGTFVPSAMERLSPGRRHGTSRTAQDDVRTFGDTERAFLRNGFRLSQPFS